MLGFNVDNTAVRVFLGMCFLSAAVALVLADNASAHQDSVDHGGITLTPVSASWGEDDRNIEVELRVVDEHPESISIPGGSNVAWGYKWFTYEYIEDGVFDCSVEHFAFNQYNFEEWLEENGYDDSVYETQEDIFKTGRDLFAAYRKNADGSLTETSLVHHRKSEIPDRYKDGDAKLAVCYKIEYDDGSHASPNNMVFDLADLTDSQVGVGFGSGSGGSSGGSAQGSAGTGNNSGNSNGSQQANSAANAVVNSQTNAGTSTEPNTGSTGSGPAVPSGSPNTGILDNARDNWLFYVILVAVVTAIASYMKVRSSARKHSRANR